MQLNVQTISLNLFILYSYACVCSHRLAAHCSNQSSGDINNVLNLKQFLNTATLYEQISFSGHFFFHSVLLMNIHVSLKASKKKLMHIIIQYLFMHNVTIIFYKQWYLYLCIIYYNVYIHIKYYYRTILNNFLGNVFFTENTLSILIFIVIVLFWYFTFPCNKIITVRNH